MRDTNERRIKAVAAALAGTRRDRPHAAMAEFVAAEEFIAMFDAAWLATLTELVDEAVRRDQDIDAVVSAARRST